MSTEKNARRGCRLGGVKIISYQNGRNHRMAGGSAQDAAIASIFTGTKLAGRVISAATEHLAFRAEPDGLIHVGAIFADCTAAIRAIREGA